MFLYQKIASDLKLSPECVLSTIKTSNRCYKRFFIPKRNGGKRSIYQPSPELKVLQYWVVDNIISKLPVSECAYAYRNKISIKQHALVHSKSKFIFHTDIKDFFPNINSKMLFDIFPHILALSDLCSYTDFTDVVEKICFLDGKTTIGAVSSPSISNAIMNNFDIEMHSYCHENNMKYSRYADDIFISSDSFIPNQVKTKVSDCLTKYGFKMNQKKTGFFSKSKRQKITGIIITNDSRLSIGTERKNKIKKELYNAIKNSKSVDKDKLLGDLSFLKHIEPQTYDKYVIKYSKYCNEDLLDLLKKITNNQPD